MSAQQYYAGSYATRASPNLQPGLPMAPGLSQTGMGPAVWRGGGIQRVSALNAYSQLPPAQPYSYMSLAPTIPIVPYAYEGTPQLGYSTISVETTLPESQNSNENVGSVGEDTEPPLMPPCSEPNSENVGSDSIVEPPDFTRQGSSDIIQSIPSYSCSESSTQPLPMPACSEPTSGNVRSDGIAGQPNVARQGSSEIAQSIPSFSMTSSLAQDDITAAQSPDVIVPEGGISEALHDTIQPSGVTAPEGGDVLDQVLATQGYLISRHEMFGMGLPPGALGRGGFGMVYKARKNSEDVAIKQIENFSLTEAAVLQEANILTLLEHPSIVRFIEAISFPPADWLFIVMELVDGADLLHVLTAQPDIFNEAAIRPMMFHLSAGVAYAHQVGVMHRDLKPQNILLSKEGFPKIVDFGLSRSIGGDEVLQSMVGTPGYIAPEVQDPRVPYNFPADVYSLGLVFTDMLHESHCCHWALGLIPPGSLSKYTKNWPAGNTLPNIGTGLRSIVNKMVVHVPGERLTLCDVCQALMQLIQEDPLPHHLWAVKTKLPSGPLPTRGVTASLAADIAGRGGYAVGVRVQILADGEWRRGVVQHISTSLCPGAAQVHYRLGDEDMAILVCPWQFADVLRPAPALPESNPNAAFVPVGTMTFLPAAQFTGSSPILDDTVPLSSSKMSDPLRSASTAGDDPVGGPGRLPGTKEVNSSIISEIPLSSSKMSVPLRSASTAGDDPVGAPGELAGTKEVNSSIIFHNTSIKVSAKAALEEPMLVPSRSPSTAGYDHGGTPGDLVETKDVHSVIISDSTSTKVSAKAALEDSDTTSASHLSIPVGSGATNSRRQAESSDCFYPPTSTVSNPSRPNLPAVATGMNLRSAIHPISKSDVAEDEVSDFGADAACGFGFQSKQKATPKIKLGPAKKKHTCLTQ